jgi:hypothetical protein
MADLHELLLSGVVSLILEMTCPNLLYVSIEIYIQATAGVNVPLFWPFLFSF